MVEHLHMSRCVVSLDRIARVGIHQNHSDYYTYAHFDDQSYHKHIEFSILLRVLICENK